MTTGFLQRNKLSIKILMGGTKSDNGKKVALDVLAHNNNKDVKLFTVYGRAEAVIKGQSTYGEYKGLVGQFYAKSEITGEKYSSTKMFLTKEFTSQLEARLEQNPGNAVEFSAEITVCKDDAIDGPGYFYVVAPKRSEQVKSFELKALEELDSPLLLGNG
jgi:hypothetical protein